MATALSTVAFGMCGVVAVFVDTTNEARLPAGLLFVVGLASVVWVIVSQVSLSHAKSRITDEVSRLRIELRDERQKTADRTVSETADGLNHAFSKATDLLHDGRQEGEDGEGLFSDLARAIEMHIGHRSRVYVYAPADVEPNVDEYLEGSADAQPEVEAYALMFDSHDRTGDEPPNPAHARDDRSHHLDEVFRNGASKVVPDTEIGPYRRYFRDSQRRTFANVRIETRGRPAGILQADACTPKAIRSSHTDFMKLLSKFVSVAVELNKLHVRTKQASVLGQGLGAPTEPVVGTGDHKS